MRSASTSSTSSAAGRTPSSFSGARTWWMGWSGAVLAAALLVGLATLPPFVGERLQALLMRAFAPVCHQLPARSFWIQGAPLAVGHRCYGIYVGLFVGTLGWPALRAQSRWIGCRAGGLLLAAGAPAGIDWLLGVTGLWANVPASRFATGGLLGLAAGVLFARALAGALAQAPQNA